MKSNKFAKILPSCGRNRSRDQICKLLSCCEVTVLAPPYYFMKAKNALLHTKPPALKETPDNKDLKKKVYSYIVYLHDLTNLQKFIPTYQFGISTFNKLQ